MTMDARGAPASVSREMAQRHGVGQQPGKIRGRRCVAGFLVQVRHVFPGQEDRLGSFRPHRCQEGPAADRNQRKDGVVEVAGGEHVVVGRVRAPEREAREGPADPSGTFRDPIRRARRGDVRDLLEPAARQRGNEFPVERLGPHGMDDKTGKTGQDLFEETAGDCVGSQPLFQHPGIHDKADAVRRRALAGKPEDSGFIRQGKRFARDAEEFGKTDQLRVRVVQPAQERDEDPHPGSAARAARLQMPLKRFSSIGIGCPFIPGGAAAGTAGFAVFTPHLCGI